MVALIVFNELDQILGVATIVGCVYRQRIDVGNYVPTNSLRWAGKYKKERNVNCSIEAIDLGGKQSKFVHFNHFVKCLEHYISQQSPPVADQP